MSSMLADTASKEALAGIGDERAIAVLTAATHKRFALISVFASCMMLTGRSALVPSRMQHTIALGVAMAVPIVAVPVAWYRPPAGSAPGALMNLAISTSSSWLVGIAVCAVLSMVIYGLHEDVEKARRLGQYTLEKKIGEGGMGVVYLARHALLRRPTAVKLLARTKVLDANPSEPRSDIYALGAVAYFMLTGSTVFGGKTVVEVCSHHLYSPVAPPSDRTSEPIPRDLEALVLRCLAMAPGDRPTTAAALETELAALDVERGARPTRRPGGTSTAARSDAPGDDVRSRARRRVA